MVWAQEDGYRDFSGRIGHLGFVDFSDPRLITLEKHGLFNETLWSLNVAVVPGLVEILAYSSETFASNDHLGCCGPRIEGKKSLHTTRCLPPSLTDLITSSVDVRKSIKCHVA